MASASKDSVILNDVSVTFQTLQGEVPAIEDLQLEVPAGQFLCIVGPSGCGKSTILNLIAGLLKPTSGSVAIFGKTVHEPNKNIGYMLQQDYLFPWRTVLKNSQLGLEIHGLLNQPRYMEKVQSLLKTYGLFDFLDHYPHQLSGGMRQRVALVRTLALEPQLFLLDEPFSALDYQTRTTIQEEVWWALRKRGSTIIMVTHDIGEAVALADRVIVLTRRPTTVKSAFDIDWEGNHPGPWQTRQHSKYNYYVNLIWEELKDFVDGGT